MSCSKEFSERRGPGLTSDAIAASLRESCRLEVRAAVVETFGPPPIDGLGTTGGLKMIIEDRGNLGPGTLQRVSDQVVSRGNKTSGLQGFSTSSRTDTPWLFLDVDRTKCMALGVAVSDIFSTLQFYLGSYYVNNFNEFGRTWQVNIQADDRFRADVNAIKQLQVRSNTGRMIRLGTVLTARNVSGAGLADAIQHVRGYRHHRQHRRPGPAPARRSASWRSSRPTSRRGSMAFDWTELTYLQLQAGNSAMYVFALAVVLVFLVLAAQYESWSLPLAVILVVPMCLLCSIVGVGIAHLEVNIFTQIGFVVLVGLGEQECDPDRRIRQAEARGRRVEAETRPSKRRG